MNIFLIDNYDSFTYNLRQMLEEAGAEVCVKRNDCFDLDEIQRFDKIVLSPGPGIPDEAGLLKAAIKAYAGQKPILGVCLGHQPSARCLVPRWSICPKCSTVSRLPCILWPKTLSSPTFRPCRPWAAIIRGPWRARGSPLAWK